MRPTLLAVTALFTLPWFPSVADAHVSVAGPGLAGTNQILTFTVGHGCEGADTVALDIQIPKSVNSVRAVYGPLGSGDVKTDEAGLPVSVSFSKADFRPGDDQYYQVQIRLKVPDAPFTVVAFPTIQTCSTAEGVKIEAAWTAMEGEEGEPAPTLAILPPRHSGWNKLTVPVAVADLSIFDDAAIVWSGNAAYSSNPTTKQLIEAEPDVTPLTQIDAGAVIWVKY
jgi:uncharacterized protein YcnI